jgi:hypothetical protein
VRTQLFDLVSWFIADGSCRSSPDALWQRFDLAGAQYVTSCTYALANNETT